MEVFIFVLIIGLFLKSFHEGYGRSGGSKSVPPANYIPEISVPKQPTRNK